MGLENQTHTRPDRPYHPSGLVMDTGNPWVNLNLPVPVSDRYGFRWVSPRVRVQVQKLVQMDTEKLKSYVTKYLTD